jgi:hypothetical protein
MARLHLPGIPLAHWWANPGRPIGFPT